MGDTVCRAVTFPFTPHSISWSELDPLLRQCWSMSTQLANWAASELALIDTLTLDRSARKLPPMPSLAPGGLYALFTRSYPDRAAWAGAAAAANCVLRAVQKKYAAERLDFLWRRSRSLPTFRYPYPFPVHNQNWSAEYGKDRVPLVGAALPGGRVVLRLRGGPEMGRQLAGFAQIVGGAKRGELALYRKGTHAMAKLVAHLPARQPEGSTKTLLVRTDPNALWVAEIDGTRDRVWNQDHMRELIETHRVWLQRVSEDTKREKRVPRKMRRHIDQKRVDRCRKYNDRISTFCHEMSRQLVEFAARQKVATIIYDDEQKGYLGAGRFAWARLREMVRYKALERSIEFCTGGGNVSTNDG